MNASDSTAPISPDRRRWVAFAVVVALLAASAVGLNAAVGVMEVQFQKLPVPLRQPVAAIPNRVGSWVQLTLDRPIPHDIEEELGTKEYVFRHYADSSAVPSNRLAEFEGRSAQEREDLARRLQYEYPEHVVNFALTYYTGSVDTVPHIPERCMVAGGFNPINPRTLAWPVFPDRAAEDRDLGVRFIQFEQASDLGGGPALPTNVSYFFHVNGGYESDPITGVRLRLQDLTVRHGYFAKIELSTVGRDQGVAAGTMTRFLAAAMPAVEACLPDWDKYEPGE